jgi:trimethylamine--corrinoid protein Co-methyltransferase
VDEAELGVEAIAAVGPGGHFFGSAHTLERFEHAFYQPMLSDWRNFETWQEDGSRTAAERANRIWKQLLAEFEPPSMDPGAVDAIDSFVARRKREIGAGAGR